MPPHTNTSGRPRTSRTGVPLLLLLTAALGTPATAESAAEPLRIAYFYSPTCIECKRAQPALAAAERTYGDRVRIERYDVTRVEGLERMLAYEERYGVGEGAPPRVFVGREHLGDADAILARLDGAIRDELARRRRTAPAPATTPAPAPPDARGPATMPTTAPADPNAPAPPPAGDGPPTVHADEDHALPPPPPANGDPPAPTGRVERRFQSFRLTTVIVAGLIDGVNPCAFATIVFLLSAVAYLGKTRREVAIVGVCFTLAVFVTYLLLGMGLLLAIKAFAIDTGVSRWLTYGIAAFTFVLAGWSLFDGVRALRGGKAPRGSLGLPPRLKSAIRRVIRSGLKTRNLVLGSLLVGFLVSLLESFCTGQVYVPTIMIMLRDRSHRLTAFAYLLLYNVMFILPLAAIMVGAYFGVRSDVLGNLLKRHLPAFKFALAGLFAALGTILLVL